MNQPDRGQFSQPLRVDWISGCAILARRAAIEQAGMLDVRFFYYHEETEWCLRTRRSGWEIYNVPQARLWHKGVQRDYQPGPNVTYYNTRNRFLLLSKHRAPFFVWFFTWGRTILTLLSWTIRPKWRSKREHREAMWQGAVDFISQNWGIRKTT
jgi:GT2 family glycosyltransferase